MTDVWTQQRVETCAVLTRFRRVRPVGFVLGFAAAIVLTGGGVAAYAANGGSLLIGRSNTGTAVTTLTSSAGTPLSLKAKSGYPPFAVNSSKPVTHLNADWLDGVDASSFALAAGAHTGIIVGTSDWEDPTDPTSSVIVSVATCPTGTMLTGGGSDNVTTAGHSFINSPDTNQWVVFSTADRVGDPTAEPAIAPDQPDDITSYAVCYNPRGSVVQPDTPVAAPTSLLSPAMKDKLARAVARSSK